MPVGVGVNGKEAVDTWGTKHNDSLFNWENAGCCTAGGWFGEFTFVLPVVLITVLGAVIPFIPVGAV